MKHKVILSSYHNPVPQPVVPAYTLPAPDVHRQYQTLPPNATASSSIILNPTIPPTPSALKTSAMSGHRPFPITQDDTYGLLPLSNDWTQLQYSGTTAEPLDAMTFPEEVCHLRDIVFRDHGTGLEYPTEPISIGVQSAGTTQSSGHVRNGRSTFQGSSSGRLDASPEKAHTTATYPPSTGCLQTEAAQELIPGHTLEVRE